MFYSASGQVFNWVFNFFILYQPAGNDGHHTTMLNHVWWSRIRLGGEGSRWLMRVQIILHHYFNLVRIHSVLRKHMSIARRRFFIRLWKYLCNLIKISCEFSFSEFFTRACIFPVCWKFYCNVSMIWCTYII